MADEAKDEQQAAAADDTQDQPAEEKQDEKPEGGDKPEAKAEGTAEKKQDEAKEAKDDKPSKEYSKEVTQIVGQVEKMTVLEVADLVSAIEDKFGVSAAPVAVAGTAPAAGGEGGGDEEEKSAYTVHLAATGDKKIDVIKAVREVTELGLKEAKDLAEGAPKDVKQNVPKEEAEEAKQKLEAAGATVELK